MTYLAFLRAINIGGHTVSMERLRSIFSGLGFMNVRSYIQSGNVFFESVETDRTILKQLIETELGQVLGYEVTVFLRTLSEFEALLTADPFKDIQATENTRFCLVFIDEPIDLQMPYFSPKKEIEILKSTPGELYAVLYQEPGKPVNLGAFIENTFKVRATVRFFHTAQKILAAAQSI